MFSKIIEKIMVKVISGQDKEEMMENVMENFFKDMTADEKNSLIKKVMSHFLADLDLMSMIPQVAQVMMPKCLSMILPKLDNEAKEQFIFDMIEVLLKQGCRDITKANKNTLKTEINHLLSEKGAYSKIKQ